MKKKEKFLSPKTVFGLACENWLMSIFSLCTTHNSGIRSRNGRIIPLCRYLHVVLTRTLCTITLLTNLYHHVIGRAHILTIISSINIAAFNQLL